MPTTAGQRCQLGFGGAVRRRSRDPTVDPLTGEKAFLIKTAGAVSMLSAVCTHAGCLVKWSATESHFVCPCHGGTYDVDGSVFSGPPPKPLPEIAVRVADGQIYGEK